MLIRATDAVVTEISPLTLDEEEAADALETPGDKRYHLIGVEAFHLPDHKGHKVQVKGLLIEATTASLTTFSRFPLSSRFRQRARARSRRSHRAG